MNWARGFQRLWFAFSVLWIVAVPLSVAYLLARNHSAEATFWTNSAGQALVDKFYTPELQQQMWKHYLENAAKEQEQAHISAQLSYLFSREMIVGTLIVLLGPPAAIYGVVWIMALCTRWVTAGFRSGESPKARNSRLPNL